MDQKGKGLQGTDSDWDKFKSCFMYQEQLPEVSISNGLTFVGFFPPLLLDHK